MEFTRNAEQWASLERLRFLERLAWWCGELKRQDVMSVFGAGSALVSADFQRYQDQNPGALAYNLRRKRYEGTPGMVRMLDTSTLEDAVNQFLPGTGIPPVTGRTEGSGKAQAEWLVLPSRRPAAEVERRVFQAVLRKRKLRVRYLSVHGGTNAWREMLPRVLVHSGHRWHVRAWCLKDASWKDFSLGRMAEADWPVEADEPPTRDSDWEEWVTVTLRPHPDLEENARAAVAQEYGMKAGKLTLHVRRAMRQYLDSALRLPDADGNPLPPRLVAE